MINYQSASAESTKLVSSGKGFLQSLVVSNVGSGTRYLYIFDSLTATGTLAAPPIVINYGDTITLEGISFATGLYVASSSSFATYTAAGGSDFSINAQGNQL